MTPLISFLVVTDTAATIERVLEALRRQTIRDRVELVVACPSERTLGLRPEHVEGLGAVTVVEVDAVSPLERAQAAALRASTAPLFVIGETHAFPAPDALAAYVEAFADPTVGGVAPRLENGNPESAASWASLMVTYGRAIGGARREVEAMSRHNGAYRRELFDYPQDELAFKLANGGGADADIRARGFRLVYEPAAVMAHLNVVALGATVKDRFYSARCYAAARSRDWSPARRAAYVALSPLLPLVLGARVLRSTGWAAHRARMPRGVLPYVAVALVAVAAGEAAAYAVGAGAARDRITPYELWRERYL